MLRLRSKRIGSLFAFEFAAVSAPKHYLIRSPFILARSRTSASGTPGHSAVLTAPKFHCSPFTRGLSSERPFPAHSKVTNWVWEGIFTRSCKLRLRGRLTRPTTFNRQVDGSTLGI